MVPQQSKNSRLVSALQPSMSTTTSCQIHRPHPWVPAYPVARIVILQAQPAPSAITARPRVNPPVDANATVSREAVTGSNSTAVVLGVAIVMMMNLALAVPPMTSTLPQIQDAMA